MQGAFEVIVTQFPMAAAGMMSGMGRRLAAASAVRSHGAQLASVMLCISDISHMKADGNK